MSANQGTDEWKLERVGKVTASRVSDVIARTKTGWSTRREAYATQLAIEIISGQPYPSVTTPAMQYGTQMEPEARNAYRSTVFEDVTETGFVSHHSIRNAGASPDGLVGDVGLVEIKCPETHTHIGYFLDDKAPERYIPQMQWQMACTGRKWCDFVSYDPRAPEELRLFVHRVERDDLYISTVEEMVNTFLGEVDHLVDRLRNKLAEKTK